MDFVSDGMWQFLGVGQKGPFPPNTVNTWFIVSSPDKLGPAIRKVHPWEAGGIFPISVLHVGDTCITPRPAA